MPEMGTTHQRSECRHHNINENNFSKGSRRQNEFKVIMPKYPDDRINEA